MLSRLVEDHFMVAGDGHTIHGRFMVNDAGLARDITVHTYTVDEMNTWLEWIGALVEDISLVSIIGATPEQIGFGKEEPAHG
jgi:hypothetical protein